MRAILALVLGMHCGVAAFAGEPAPQTPGVLLQRLEDAKGRSNSQYADILGQLKRVRGQLSPAQRWHLDYLDAWHAAILGQRSKAQAMLQEIVDHSQDPALIVRAKALQINLLVRGLQFVQAYELADQLNTLVPTISDQQAREAAVFDIAQLYSLADQHDLALRYVQEMKAAHLVEGDGCSPQAVMLTIKINVGKLNSSSPELLRSIQRCLAEGKILNANTMRLDRAQLLMSEHRTQRALNLLQSIESSVLGTAFRPHITLMYAVMGQAYLRLGDDVRARESAQQVLAHSNLNAFSWQMKIAYQVLYDVDEKRGDTAAALAHYKLFAAQERSAMNDAKLRTLSYQMVKQELRARKLRVDTLKKQNRILQLQQQLDHKAAETGRLYIVLLLCGLGFVGLWLYRLLISHQRLKHVARHDGLTGILNHQHFFGDAAATLTRMQRDGRTCCLTLMDLDHFKRVNDTFGHAAGDEVLRHVIRVCQRELRACDLFGRLGGEEFGILLTDCDREQAAEIVHRIRAAIVAAPTTLANGGVIEVSASFGLACTDGDATSLQQLYASADTALYRAKHGGRNQLMVSGGSDDDGPVATATGRMVPR